MSKKEIVKYIIEEYGVSSPTDITNALKDLLGETLQEMMDTEFNEHMGYEKHQRDISDVDNKIINLYARGMSTRDISESIRDIYGIDVSTTMISKITDKIIPIVQEWHNRPLHTVYPIVFIDCVHFNVKSKNMVIKKAAYVVLGVTEDEYKEILGIYVGENESPSFGFLY